MGKIKAFFRSLMFWKKKPTPKPISMTPIKPTPKPNVGDDGGGTTVVTPVLNPNDEIQNHYQIAFKEIGIKEVRGRNHNPRVLEYHDTTGNFSDDETPWCASFVNWCLIEAYWNEEKKLYIYKGQQFKRDHRGMKALAKLVGSGSASARSFLKVGKEVSRDEVKRGDIVVFYRGKKSGWQGHVGFFAGFLGDNVKTLGGNQSNSVNIKKYPESRVLGYRRV